MAMEHLHKSKNGRKKVAAVQARLTFADDEELRFVQNYVEKHTRGSRAILLGELVLEAVEARIGLEEGPKEVAPK